VQPTTQSFSFVENDPNQCRYGEIEADQAQQQQHICRSNKCIL
jgi:hypothetical protein